MARAFDANTFSFGGAAALVDDVFQLAADSIPLVRVSVSGSLVYLRGELGHDVSGLGLILLSQDGETEPLDAPTGDYRFPRVSPDGTAAVEPLTAAGEGVSQFYPVFAPDGRLTYVQEDEATQGNHTYIVKIPGGTPELVTRLASASNAATPSEIVVVTNWIEEVEARVPPIER